MSSTSIAPPRRLFSFSEWQRNQGRSSNTIPVDRLDEQIANLVEAIASTQRALRDIRRDDGALRSNSVGPDQLSTDFLKQLDAAAQEQIEALRATAASFRFGVERAEREVQLYARDAEAAAGSAGQFLAATNVAQELTERAAVELRDTKAAATAEATTAQGWGNYAKANADNAITANQQALQWAEYLAGPVVDPLHAPGYIAGSNFPHGLYYQPVEGYGGLGGLWSAKWWAIYAAQLVGPWSFYYLGGWHGPPVPGATNPATGVRVPNPILPGSMYYDLDKHQLYVWDSVSWRVPVALTAGFSGEFVYTAISGQTVFFGPDDNGRTPVVNSSPSTVHVNGVLLVADDDYTIDKPTSTLTLVDPCQLGDVVAWEVLVSEDKLAPGAVLARKCSISPPPDGTTVSFTLQYFDPDSGLPVDCTIGTGAQLTVSVDGVLQEPGGDYVAAGNTLTMGSAPLSDAHMWVVWNQPGGDGSVLVIQPETGNPREFMATATYATPAPDFLMTYALVPAGDGAVAGVIDGRRYRFTVPVTAIARAADPTLVAGGAINIEVFGTTYPLRAPNGYTPARWGDLQKGAIAVVEYNGPRACFTLQLPTELWHQSTFTHTPMFGCNNDNSNTVWFSAWPSGGCYCLNPLSNAFQLVRVWGAEAGPLGRKWPVPLFKRKLFGNTGVPGLFVKSAPALNLALHTLYYVFYWMPDGTAEQTLELDFWPVDGTIKPVPISSPDSNTILVRTGDWTSPGGKLQDRSRAFVGMLYTKDGNLNFGFSDPATMRHVQSLAISFYTGWQLPLPTAEASWPQTAHDTWEAAPTDAAFVINATTHCPIVHFNAEVTASVAGVTASMRVRAEGIAVDGNGVSTPSVFDWEQRSVTIDTAGGKDTLECEIGSAWSDGYYLFTPYVSFTGPAGATVTWRMNITGDVWM